MKKAIVLVLGAVLLLNVTVAQEDSRGTRDGETRQTANTAPLEVWNASTESWVSPEAFWEHYALRPGGKHWGMGAKYPLYSEVNELDTFIVEIDGGTCLMEFWHRRWRRANDVRRWNTVFNDYSACPTVFE